MTLLPRGILPALFTPFDRDRRIDDAVLDALIDLHASQGVKGYYLTGSTAECHLLSLEERQRLTAHILDRLPDTMTAIVHVGTLATSDAVKLAEHAAASGATVLSAIPPFYYSYRFEEIAAHYQAIHEASGLPMVVYHYPAQSGVSFTHAQYRQLMDDAGVIGVKFTSKDLDALQGLKAALPELTIYSGYDELLLAGLAMGADGAIGSTYNFAYPLASGILDRFRRGDIDGAQVLQNRLNRILDVTLPLGHYPATKYLMRRYGIETEYCRRPFGDLTAEDKVKLDRLLEAADA